MARPTRLRYPTLFAAFALVFAFVPGVPGQPAAEAAFPDEGGTLELFASGFDAPTFLAMGDSGDLYVSDEASGVVSRVTPDGMVLAVASGFSGPSGLAFDNAGLLHVSDDTNRVFTVSAAGTVSVLIEATAGLANPNQIAFDATDNLYVLSAGGFLSVFSHDGTLIDLQLAAGFDTPQGLLVDDGSGVAYVVDMSGSLYAVDMITGATGLVMSPDVPNEGGSGRDSSGMFFISDWNRDRVIQVDGPNRGAVECVTGVTTPRGLAFDAAERIYIASYTTGSVYRADGCTEPWLNVTFLASYNDDHIFGSHNWPSDRTVTVTRNGTESSTAIWLGGQWNVWDLAIEPGDELVATDGYVTRTLVISDVEVTSVDLAADTVSGVAAPTTEVQVVLNGDPVVTRAAVADGDGTWSASFAGEADLTFAQDGGADQPDGDGDQTRWSWRTPNPRISVDAATEEIWLFEFGPSAPIDVIVDGAAFATVADEWDDGYLDLLGVMDIVPGTVVEATSSIGTKSHVVTVMHITGVDSGAETVTGFAQPDTTVEVWIGDGDPRRWVTADAGSTWVADFANPGPLPEESSTYDIGPGTQIHASDTDGDFDSTTSLWMVSDPPMFSVRPDSDTIEGFNWPEGATITMEIDDPATPESPDYAASAMVGDDPIGTAGNVGFGFGEEFDVRPGHVVTVTDGATTKVHIVTNVTVTAVDVDNDLVSGTADPGDEVYVSIREGSEGNRWRTAITDAGGVWEADFSTDPGGGAVDIRPGDTGSVEEEDDDGDCTEYSWRVANPTFSVETPFYGWSSGEGWIEGATVTLSVDDGSGGGPEYTDTVIVERQGPEPGEVGFDFNTEPFEIRPGFVVTVDDGTTTKTLDVVGITIDVIDETADMLAGTAPPDTWVEVEVGNEWDGCGYQTLSGSGGDWVADFGGDPCYFDVQPGDGGSAQVFDYDGDSSHRGWYLEPPANPHFNVDPSAESVWGEQWTPGVSVDITVNGNLVDTQLIDESGNFGTGFAPVDVAPGDHIVVTDGSVTKELWISRIAVTAVDDAADTVHGVADPGADIDVWVDDTDVGRHEVADITDGTWTADFGNPGDEDGEAATIDLTPGIGGGANQCDDDGDCTFARWELRNPTLLVELPHDQISVNGFGPNAPVDVAVDDDDDPGNGVLWSETGWTDADGNAWFHTDGVEIEPGQTVTAASAEFFKSTVVTSIRITGVDYDNDLVFGVADPFSVARVEVRAEGSEGDNHRIVSADAFGDWAADYALPGDEGSPDLVDLDTGMEISAEQTDEDADQTVFGWQLPRFDVDPSAESVWGEQWTPGVSVDITVNGNLVDTQLIDERGNFGTGFAPVDIAPGDHIVVTDGSVTKELWISPIAVTAVDDATDTVHGVADPGADIDVWVDDTDVGRHEVADITDGTWTADFGNPGDEDGEAATIDLTPGIGGGANQCDDDGDCTFARWELARPRLSAMAYGQDWVRGEGFGSFGPVEIAIVNDLGCPGIVESEGGEFQVDGGELCADGDLRPGHQIRVSTPTGDVIRELVIHEVVITDVDTAGDSISGLGTIGDEVWVVIGGEDPEPATRGAVPDPVTGTWTVWFDTEPDAVAGESGRTEIDGLEGAAMQFDADGDQTESQWTTAAPSIAVNPVDDDVSLENWPTAAPLTVTLYESPAMLSEIYSETHAAAGPYYLTNIGTDLGGIDLRAGYHIVATAGSVATAHTITTLSIESFDFDNDLILGSATPGATVHAGAGDAEVAAEADGTGTWSADFGGLVDFGSRVDGFVAELDEAGNATYFFYDARYVSTEVGSGGTVGSGDGDGNVGEDDPFEGSLTLPGGGGVTMTESPASGGPEGFLLVGSRLRVTSTATGTPEHPLILVFHLYGPGVGVEDVSLISVFKDGVEVPECATPPDYGHETGACVSARSQVGDEMWITVYTLGLSTWTLGVRAVELGELSGPVDPLALGQPAAVSAPIANRTGAPLVATIDWGDGTQTELRNTFSSGTVAAEHVYTAPNVYPVTLEVLDPTGGRSVAEYRYVVVFDPAGKRIRGVGSADPTAGQRLWFRFNAGYERGTSIPKGAARFVLDDGGGDRWVFFDSSSLESMFIFEGWAYLDGRGDILIRHGWFDWEHVEVDFRLTITDAAGTGEPDTLRLEVRRADHPDLVIFDTQWGDDAFAAPTTPITKGRIEID